MTLCESSTVTQLGITKNNFYGGAVSFAHERTKVIMHDLLSPSSAHPDQWNHNFAHEASHLALPGYSVFNQKDLSKAVIDILKNFGAARIKLATGADGLGQFVVNDITDLEPIIQQITATNVINLGACVELDLQDPVTYSINTDTIGTLQIGSVGIHRRNMENMNAHTEIGTDYDMLADDVTNINLDVTNLNHEHFRTTYDLVNKFDQLVNKYLPHILLTRKTYQAIIGTDSLGNSHAGILEQSWRRGGSSANTLLAAQEFLNDPSLTQVSCSQDNAFTGTIEPEHWVLSTCRDLPVVARVTNRHYN